MAQRYVSSTYGYLETATT